MAIVMEVVSDKSEEEIYLFTLWDLSLLVGAKLFRHLVAVLKAFELIKFHIYEMTKGTLNQSQTKTHLNI